MARRIALLVLLATSLASTRAYAASSASDSTTAEHDAPAADATTASESQATPPPTADGHVHLGGSRADSTAVPRARVRVTGGPVAVLRSGPGTGHAIVTTVAEDDELVVDARSGSWFHVTAENDASGWLHESLFSSIDKQKFTFKPDPGRAERQRTLHVLAFVGNYAADREDNGFLYGARMGYAINSRFSFEVGAGRTQIVRSTFIIEQLFNLRLEEETFDVFFYEAGLMLDVLPGRRVTPFFAAAVGATVLNARVEPTWSVAIGTRAFMSKRIALRWEIRDHRLEGGNQFTRFTGDNLEFSAGTELMF